MSAKPLSVVQHRSTLFSIVQCCQKRRHPLVGFRAAKVIHFFELSKSSANKNAIYANFA